MVGPEPIAVTLGNTCQTLTHAHNHTRVIYSMLTTIMLLEENN